MCPTMSPSGGSQTLCDKSLKITAISSPRPPLMSPCSRRLITNPSISQPCYGGQVKLGCWKSHRCLCVTKRSLTQPSTKEINQRRLKSACQCSIFRVNSECIEVAYVQEIFKGVRVGPTSFTQTHLVDLIYV